VKELRNDTGWSAETDLLTQVSILCAAPDTVVMVFQRPDEGRGTLTTSLPVSLEAFKSLVALGVRMLDSIDKQKSVL